jgi:hypothetical protein
MRVQIVQYHRDPFRCRVVPVGQLAHRRSPIGARAPLGDLDLAPAGEGVRKTKTDWLRRVVRTHSPRAVAVLARRVEKFGFHSPVAGWSHPCRSPHALEHRDVDRPSARLPSRLQTRRCVPAASPRTLLSEAAVRFFQGAASGLVRNRVDLLEFHQLVR